MIARAVGAWCLVVAATAALPAERKGQPVKKRRILYNSDGTNVFFVKEPLSAADVQARVDEVAGMQVGTFLICPNAGMNLYYPGKAVPMLGEGRAVPPKGGSHLDRIARNLRALVAAGHDPMGLIIDRAREKGLDVFVTYRMNEVHDTHIPDSLLLSTFWTEHPEWRVTRTGTWNDATLNYAVPEVREHVRARLREILTRYGDRIDGLELDWQRFPSHFPKGQGERHLAVLTQFIRDVRGMTKACGERRGRPLLLAVRVCRNLARCRAIGLDPTAWAKEGLVDFVTVSRFLHNNEGVLAIGEFKKAIPGIPIYGSIEFTTSVGEYRAEARKLWAAGADGIYVFNFFCSRELKPPVEPPFFLLKELGDPATVGE